MERQREGQTDRQRRRETQRGGETSREKERQSQRQRKGMGGIRVRLGGGGGFEGYTERQRETKRNLSRPRDS